MSQRPDPERQTDAQRQAEARHPEVFQDRDAGQVPPRERPPEPVVLTGLRKGCLWAIVFTAVLLLIIAVTWQWAWEAVEPTEVMDPGESRPPGTEVVPPDPIGDRVIGDEPDERDRDPQ